MKINKLENRFLNHFILFPHFPFTRKIWIINIYEDFLNSKMFLLLLFVSRSLTKQKNYDFRNVKTGRWEKQLFFSSFVLVLLYWFYNFRFLLVGSRKRVGTLQNISSSWLWNHFFFFIVSLWNSSLLTKGSEFLSFFLWNYRSDIPNLDFVVITCRF